MSKTLDKIPLAESFIQLQIQVKRKEFQDFKEELHQLEDKKQKLMKLQEQLREEQTGHVHDLNNQLKEQERTLEQTQLEYKDQVESAVQSDQELKCNHEKELEELHCQLARLQVQVEELHAERQEWLQYQNEGSMENQQKIQKLGKDIASTQSIFQEVSEYFQRSMTEAVEEIDKKTEQAFDETMQLAVETAIENQGNHHKRSIKLFDCLKKEIAIYVKEVSVLESTVQQLENENLELVNKLLQDRLDDAQISVGNAFHAHIARLGSFDIDMDKAIMKISPEETPELVGRPPYPLQPLAEAEEAQQERDGTDSGSMTPSTALDLSKIHFSSEANFMVSY
ncbi:coiled-coil domain-containing protein 83 [Xyrauchen texanus]|uniref:coiled-coil domain-containing protein 83 n=1 Tax=Xyrauchen texanus TaxID=154827 RepID=UPI002241FA32|nr:coiled-coil domain-containing protein 83 [Xyrauchen texanus]